MSRRFALARVYQAGIIAVGLVGPLWATALAALCLGIAMAVLLGGADV